MTANHFSEQVRLLMEVLPQGAAAMRKRERSSKPRGGPDHPCRSEPRLAGYGLPPPAYELPYQRQGLGFAFDRQVMAQGTYQSGFLGTAQLIHQQLIDTAVQPRACDFPRLLTEKPGARKLHVVVHPFQGAQVVFKQLFIDQMVILAQQVGQILGIPIILKVPVLPGRPP